MSNEYGNIAYGEYTTVADWEFDAINFYEYYDLDSDPWQLHSIFLLPADNILFDVTRYLRYYWNCAPGGIAYLVADYVELLRIVHYTVHVLVIKLETNSKVRLNAKNTIYYTQRHYFALPYLAANLSVVFCCEVKFLSICD